MSDVISEYRRWKQQSEELRAKAKQAMEVRFRDLLLEAAAIADEYRADFGGVLKPPPGVTAFRYKSAAKRPKKARAAAKPAAPEPKPQQPAAKPGPKEARLQKRLGTARKKLETAKAAGEPTKNIEDRIYELEDELRLSRAQ